MKVLRLCLVGVAGILLGASANEATHRTAPGSPATEERHSLLTLGKDAAPLRPEQHPCDWVETCQFPCAGESKECCQADWNCPADLTLPRC
ncbi:MAG: hypothetical protein ABW123_17800 [Cystobacter sp.]